MLTTKRNLVRNGNSTHVAIPPRVLEYLRWRAGDTLVVEVVDTDKLVIRMARVEDLRAPRLPEQIDANLQAVAK